MMTMFRGYRGDDALLVDEEGMTITAPVALLRSAGLLELRTGQRLVVRIDDQGAVTEVGLP
jgi:hypothetical protein